MIAPLKSMTVTSAFGVQRTSSGLPDNNGTLRHIGVDLRASVGTPVYAPDAGTVTLIDDVGLKLVEIKIGDKLHRFLHLSKNILQSGQSVKQGQLIGYSGDTGNVAAHLHWDIRKGGTAWNASYYNYYDPMKLIEEEDMKIDRPLAIRLERILTMQHSPPEAKINAAIGKDAVAYLDDRYNDADFVGNKTIVRNKYPEALAQIEELGKDAQVLPKGIHKFKVD